MFASENPKQYDAVISSGQACPTAAMLVLKLRKKPDLLIGYGVTAVFKKNQFYSGGF